MRFQVVSGAVAKKIKNFKADHSPSPMPLPLPMPSPINEKRKRRGQVRVKRVKTPKQTVTPRTKNIARDAANVSVQTQYEQAMQSSFFSATAGTTDIA